MSRIVRAPRIGILALALMLLACGAQVGNTFSTINNSLPGDDAPAATEPPEEQPVAAATEILPVAALPTATLVAIQGTSVPPSVSLTAQPAIPERRRLTLEFPPQIRAGDSDRVRLTLEVDDQGNLTPTAEVAGNLVTGEVIEIPNLYETHHVIVGAQFNIAGLQVSPADRVSQSLAPGQSVTFYWSILPGDVGIYRGTIWLYLTFVDMVSGIQTERAISAQPVEIEAVNYLGLSVNTARSFGVVGSIIGTVLGFPFLEEIVKFLFRRRRV